MFTLFWIGFHAGIVWTAKEQNWNKSFKHIEHRSGAFGREGLGHSNPVLTPEYLLPWIPVLFTFFTVQIPVHTALKCWRELIRYVTLHFQDWRGSFAPLKKSRGNHSCYVWTEDSSGMVCASAVRYIVWAELEFLVGCRWLVDKLYAQLGPRSRGLVYE